jgi:hypothetical protein
MGENYERPYTYTTTFDFNPPAAATAAEDSPAALKPNFVPIFKYSVLTTKKAQRFFITEILN